jgi:hypothetical protein
MTEHSTTPQQRSGDNNSGAVDSARHVADDVGTSTREAVSEVAEDVKTHTLHVIDDAKTQVRSQAETQTHRASEFTRDLAHELQSMAEHGDSGYLTSLARDGASRLERFSSHLDERGLEGALDDVRRFARRRPGLFLAGCFGAGVVLGRIIHHEGSTISQAMSSQDDHGSHKGSQQALPGRDWSEGASAGPAGQQLPQATGPAPAQDYSPGFPR